MDNKRVSTKNMRPSIQELLSQLKNEPIKTWFDLGLFLDRLKDKKSSAGFKPDYYSFKEK